jgi:GMP synthase-like glutamine amidotransferase
MNNGVKNQATRCFKQIVDAFRKRATAFNEQLDFHFTHVQPRNLGELPPDDVDLVLSSGGPGSPFDGYEDPWCTGYRKFLDRCIELNQKDPSAAPKALLVCHSFELGVIHFKVGTMQRRPSLKFGLMPAYTTRAGQKEDFLRPYGDRLFAWEHRNWEAVDIDLARLGELGGALLATESREGHAPDKGRAALSLKFGPGIWGTQFHPEADKPGAMAWIEKPEHKIAVTDAYGQLLYERMLKSLSNPDRLAKTFALFIPGWLTFRFNEIAPQKSLRPLPPPEPDPALFERD